jgi:hypothetical protein
MTYRSGRSSRRPNRCRQTLRHAEKTTLERVSDQPPPPPPATSESADRRGDHLEQRLVAQIERNRELAKIVEERDRDLASAAKSNELNGKSMLVLKQQLDDARQTEERLVAQLRELKSASQRAPEPESATASRPPMSKPNGCRAAAGTRRRTADTRHRRWFRAWAEQARYLSFSQLAGLGVQNRSIEANLPTFHGRIERDDWPGSRSADGRPRTRRMVAAGAERAEHVAANQLKDSRRLVRSMTWMTREYVRSTPWIDR